MKCRHHRAATTCRHCKRSFAAQNLSVHEKRCPHNPDLFDAQRAALDDGTGAIRGSNYYDRDMRNGMASTTLRMAFGTWGKVAEFYGLSYPDKQGRSKNGLRKSKNGLSAPLAPHERLRTMPTPEQEIASYRMRDTLYTPHGCPACQVVEDEREVRWVLR